jgi:hypothetical protein
VSLASLAYESQHSLRQWLVGRWYAQKRRSGAATLDEDWKPHRVLVVLAGLTAIPSCVRPCLQACDSPGPERT